MPPESKTLCTVLGVCIADEGTGVLGRTALPALYWLMDKVGAPKSKSVTTGKPISSWLQCGRLIQAALICLDCLGLHAKLSSRLWTHMSGRVGLLTGPRVFWCPGPTCQGRP
jgi:hypothetical protein